MNAYQIISQSVEQLRPDLLAALNPRIYEGAGAWGPTKVPAVNLAGTLAALLDRSMDQYPQMRDLITRQVCATAAQLIAYQVPTYFVERELALAVMRTDPPAQGRWTDMRLPFPAGLLILPPDLVIDERGCAYNYITWLRVKAGEVIKLDPTHGQGFNNDALVFTSASVTDPSFGTITKSLDANTWPHARLPEDKEAGPHLGPIIPTESEAINLLSHLAIGLLMAFEARPTLYTPDRQVKASTRRGSRSVWRPRILGAGYRIAIQSAPGEGSHASPRLHWRRGHFRHQRFGPELREVKTIWIEPVLVGAESGE